MTYTARQVEQSNRKRGKRNVKFDMRTGGVAADPNATDRQVKYDIRSMEKMSWEEQVDRVEEGKAKRDDVMVITKEGEMRKYGINDRITLRQAVYGKGTREKSGKNNRSAHGIPGPIMKKLRNEVLHPAAKIISGKGTVIVTGLKDQNDNYIILPIGPKTFDGGIKTMDSASVYGKDIMPALFGKFDNGEFKADASTAIVIYKNNAYDILKTGSDQYGALKDVADAIEKSITKTRGCQGEKRFSLPGSR